MPLPDKDQLQDQFGFVYIHIPKTAGRSTIQALGAQINNVHRNMKYYEQSLGADVLAKRFKFTIVRNPWDRATSWYKFFTIGMSMWKGISETAPTFSEWVIQFAKRPGNQLDIFSYLRTASGAVTIDQFLRFENLVSDYAILKGRLDALGMTMPETLPTVGMKDRSSNFPFPNGQSAPVFPKTYQEFYTTQESIDAVANCNKELILEFGYTFK